MIARDIDDRTILIRQEDHAELAAQFAAHWGADRIARLRPYNTVVTAATYHDTHFRQVEAELHMDPERGRPYHFRNQPLLPSHLTALRQNIAWVASHDPYAALLVSMHHTGLRKNRYGVITYSRAGSQSATPPNRYQAPEAMATFRELEEEQRTTLEALSKLSMVSEESVRFNYRLLQTFDLLSLHLCCDGYAADELQEATLGPVPVTYGAAPEINLRLTPQATGTVRLDPYPFDRDPLEVSVSARIVRRLVGHTDADCRAAYFAAARTRLVWTITS